MNESKPSLDDLMQICIKKNSIAQGGATMVQIKYFTLQIITIIMLIFICKKYVDGALENRSEPMVTAPKTYQIKKHTDTIKLIPNYSYPTLEMLQYNI
jgi:hypothetical protein